MRKSKLFMGILTLTLLTGCGEAEVQEEEITPAEETVEETIAETETSGPVEETVSEAGPEVQPFGEENGIEFSKETSFTLPWAFSFSNLEMTEPKEYPGVSVNKKDSVINVESVKYIDEGDKRTVEFVMQAISEYQLVNDMFLSDGGSFAYVYSTAPMQLADYYTGMTYPAENTCDDTNTYDMQFEIEWGEDKYDIEVKKKEEHAHQKSEWELDPTNDEREIRDAAARQLFTYQLTYPVEYDGAIICIKKDGTSEVNFSTMHEEATEDAGNLADMEDFTNGNIIFLRVSDLIDAMGEQVESLEPIEESEQEN